MKNEKNLHVYVHMKEIVTYGTGGEVIYHTFLKYSIKDL